MASLDNSFNAIPRFVDVPGFERTVGVWKLKMLSSSDTVTVPELDTRSASVDQSSARVLEPATGVTVTAAATSSDNENVLTVAGSSAGSDVILFTVHVKGRHNALAVPDPS